MTGDVGTAEALAVHLGMRSVRLFNLMLTALRQNAAALNSNAAVGIDKRPAKGLNISLKRVQVGLVLAYYALDNRIKTEDAASLVQHIEGNVDRDRPSTCLLTLQDFNHSSHKNRGDHHHETYFGWSSMSVALGPDVRRSPLESLQISVGAFTHSDIQLKSQGAASVISTDIEFIKVDVPIDSQPAVILGGFSKSTSALVESMKLRPAIHHPPSTATLPAGDEHSSSPSGSRANTVDSPIHMPKRVTTVKVHFVEISVGAFYRHRKYPRLLQLKVHRSSLALDSTASDQDVQLSIKDMDSEPCPGVAYKPAAGGQVTMSVDEFTVGFEPMDVLFTAVEDIKFTGRVYLASTLHPCTRKPTVEIVPLTSRFIKRSVVMESCWGSKSKQFELYPTVSSEDTPIGIEVGLQVPSVPLKLYGDVGLEIGHMHVHRDTAAAMCITAISAIGTNCTRKVVAVTEHGHPVLPSAPPSPAVQSLAWWDSLRYWVHGAIHVTIRRVSITNTFLDARILPVALTCTAQSVCISVSSEVFTLSVEELAVTIGAECEEDLNLENPSQGTSLHPEGTCQSKFHPERGRNSTGSASGSSWSSMEALPLSASVPLYCRLGYLPQMNILISYSRSPEHDSDLKKLRRSHHDVDLNTVPLHVSGHEEIEIDKYAGFRCVPGSLQLAMRIRCLDMPESPITVCLRVDVLHRLLSAVDFSSSHVGDKDGLSSLTPRHSTDKKEHGDRGVRTRDNTKQDHPRDIGFSHVIGLAEVECEVACVVLCSWGSADDLNGVVFIQNEFSGDFSWTQSNHNKIPEFILRNHQSQSEDERMSPGVNESQVRGDKPGFGRSRDRQEPGGFGSAVGIEIAESGVSASEDEKEEVLGGAAVGGGELVFNHVSAKVIRT